MAATPTTGRKPQPFRFGRHGSRAGAIAIGVTITVATGLALHEFRFGNGLRNASYDLLLVARGDKPAKEAVLVYLDETSYERLNQPLNAPWDRALHAKLIDRLSAAGAKAIVFDIVFSDPNPDKSAADRQLTEAVRRNGRVVLAADNVPDGPASKHVQPPFRELMDVAANVGSAETAPSSDLVIRVHTPRGDNAMSSLTWAAAEFLRLPATQQPGGEDRERWMNYYGRPGLLPACSYYAALEPALVRDEFFHDKVVFIGARLITKFAGERKDEYPSPFSVWLGERAFMSGVEIQATAFLNLLRGDWLTRCPNGVERLLLILGGVGFGGGLLLLRPVRAVMVAMTGAGLTAVVSFLVFKGRLVWFPWLLVAVQAGIAAAWAVLFNSVQLYVQKRLFEFTLGLYLSPKLVAKFSSSPALLKPGAEKQTLTLMFSDIADFTQISEKMDSDDLAAMMNEYFQGAVARCIHKTDGTVVKYIGDAIFALWNAPEQQPDHAARACEAALHFHELSNQPVRGRRLHTRIGLHTGVANVGNFGSEDRVDYTAIGENVNLASRLEGLNKELGTACLMSGATKAEIGERCVTRRLGQFQLKGFESLVEVHELLGFPEQAEATRGWREAFAEALNNFEQRNLVFAEIGFRRVLEMKLDDGPARFYLARIQEMAELELPDSWATHTIVKSK